VAYHRSRSDHRGPVGLLEGRGHLQEEGRPRNHRGGQEAQDQDDRGSPPPALDDEQEQDEAAAESRQVGALGKRQEEAYQRDGECCNEQRNDCTTQLKMTAPVSQQGSEQKRQGHRQHLAE
jgi:hypothetical protein